MHTSRWDHEVELAGKRVGVIGTGASAVQVIPAIAGMVEKLTVFQRTPIWCMPKPDRPLDRRERWVLENVPGARFAARLMSQVFVELNFPLAAHFYGIVPLADRGEKIGRAFLKKEVHDPDVRDRLTPRYGLGCKRPSFHNEYLRDLQPRERGARDHADRAGHGRRSANPPRANTSSTCWCSRPASRCSSRSSRSTAPAGSSSTRGGTSTGCRPTRA